jgi:DNA polymerase
MEANVLRYLIEHEGKPVSRKRMLEEVWGLHEDINRAPEPDEVAACSPFLMRQIDSIQPKVIVCLGATAAKTILNTTRGISQFRGEWLEWRGHKLMATYHPAYLLRNPPAKADVWKDLQKVMAELGLQLPKKSKS